MTDRQAPPWWASDLDDVGPDEDEDPLTRHRRARAGERADGPEEGAATHQEPSARAATPGWWGPAAEAVARLSEDLAATAADNAGAARGHRPWHDRADGPDGGAADPSGASATDGRGRDEAARDAAHLEVCGVCPICVGLRALGTHRPELVGHLTEAARHLAAAVRSVVEQAAPEDGPADAEGAQGLTRIDLDDGPGDVGGR